MLLFLAAACSKPPPAPAGLTDSLRFLLREFHSDDETLGSGLTGLMDWFDADGGELLDAKADIDSVGAFQLEDLAREDVARLPVEGNPDPSLAPGVVSIAEMQCGLARAQKLLVRSDQHVVFEGPWRGYQRDYVTGRAPFERAALEELEPIREEITEETLDLRPDAMLLTENQVESSKLGISMDFDLVLRMRHGLYDVQGEPAEALVILGFFPRAAEAESGDTLKQSWSIEVNLDRPGRRTLRVFGAWSELESALLPPDSVYVLTTAVNEAQDTSERMSRICAGELDIPPEGAAEAR